MSSNFIKFISYCFILVWIKSALFSQSFSNNNQNEIPEIFIDTTSIEVIEWGYLDSVKGLYYYEDELYSGPVIKYLSSGLMEGEFQNGLRHGLWQTFNRIGQPLMIGYYDKGKKNGKFEQWYDDGKKRHRELIASFVNDQYDGVYREWYENGKKSIVGTYQNGKEQKSPIAIFTRNLDHEERKTQFAKQFLEPFLNHLGLKICDHSVK